MANGDALMTESVTYEELAELEHDFDDLDVEIGEYKGTSLSSGSDGKVHNASSLCPPRTIGFVMQKLIRGGKTIQCASNFS